MSLVQNNLSVLDSATKGVAFPPVRTYVKKKADQELKEGSPAILRLPPRIDSRPLATFSLVDIDTLPVLSPPADAPPIAPAFSIGGGKDLELVLQVLLHHDGQPHLLRTLVET